MKLHKYSILFICLLTCFTVNINAKENDDMVEHFLYIVEGTDIYFDYVSSIDKMEVKRETHTEYGKRYTIQYSIKNSNSYLTFIGDDNLEIVDVTLISLVKDNYSVLDLQRNTTTNLYGIQKGPLYKCTRYECVEVGSKVSYDPQPLCSQTVGRACDENWIFRKPIAKVLCRAGVWVMCNIRVDWKECTRYNEVIYGCTL